MQLTSAQQAMLDGAAGPAVATGMRWLVAWGEGMAAERLVPVENVLGGSPGTPPRLADEAEARAAAGLVQDWRALWATPVRPYTVTSGQTRLTYQQPHFAPAEPADPALYQEMIELASRAGTIATWSCTPYLVGNVPLKGQICAWTESSAVVFINSVLGARTTRHGAESARAAALTGYVPEFGVLRDEGRKGDFVVEVKVPLQNATDYGALGYFTGRLVGLRIPVYTGLRPFRSEDAKQLCAALATGGGVTMFHAVGVTPEAPTLEAAFQGQPAGEKHVFDERALAAAYESLRLISGNDVDFVYVGCPHCTLAELAEIIRLLRGRRVADGVIFAVALPYALKANAQRQGLLQLAEAAGVQIMTDTCPALAFVPRHKRMITNSVKQAHYLRALMGTESLLANVEECVEAAVSGRWR